MAMTIQYDSPVPTYSRRSLIVCSRTSYVACSPSESRAVANATTRRQKTRIATTQP